MTPELAEKYARDEDTPIADQVALANIAYAGKLGNSKEADSDKDGKLDEDDDGWKYRGAGILQITGKFNYEEVQKRIDKYAPTSNINILISKDIHTLEGSILAGLGFWIWKDLYKIADLGKEEVNVDNVTKVINLYTESIARVISNIVLSIKLLTHFIHVSILSKTFSTHAFTLSIISPIFCPAASLANNEVKGAKAKYNP